MHTAYLGSVPFGSVDETAEKNINTTLENLLSLTLIYLFLSNFMLYCVLFATSSPCIYGTQCAEQTISVMLTDVFPSCRVSYHVRHNTSSFNDVFKNVLLPGVVNSDKENKPTNKMNKENKPTNKMNKGNKPINKMNKGNNLPRIKHFMAIKTCSLSSEGYRDNQITLPNAVA